MIRIVGPRQGSGRGWTQGDTARLGAALLAACLLGACDPKERPPADPALDLAWRLASAIRDDPADRARCQEKVAREYLDRGKTAEAAALARRIEGWRRAVLLADISAELTYGGDAAAAAKLLDEARQAERGLTEWRADRAAAHRARAEAALTNLTAVAATLAERRIDHDTRGRLQSSMALALALAGRPDDAVAFLDAAAASKLYEDSLSRVEGLLLVARKGRLDAERRAKFLDLAWETAGSVPGWKAWELRLDILDEAGRAAPVRPNDPRIEFVVTNVLALPLPGHLKAPLMARAARTCGRLGAVERVAALWAAAEPIAMADLQNIEQPAVWAGFAEAFATAGGASAALELFQRAADAASALVNPRPRGMAATEIALSAARSGFRDAPLMESLRRLLATFHDG